MRKVTFDVETTSANKETCRIVQLAIKMVDENGKVLISRKKMYDPGVPMEPSATEVTGITDEMLKGKGSFEDDAPKLQKIFEGAILIGYNLIQFDIPVLIKEFERAGVELKLSGVVWDIMKLETLINPRTLSAVYERYTGNVLDGAHDAMADVTATDTVFQHQLAKMKALGMNVEETLKMVGIPEGAADSLGKLKFDDNKDLVFNFGKHVHKRVLQDSETKQYANWVISNKDFSDEIKSLLKKELQKEVAKSFKKATAKLPVTDKVSTPIDFGTPGEMKGPKEREFYPITQRMIHLHNTTGKSYEELRFDPDLPF